MTARRRKRSRRLIDVDQAAQLLGISRKKVRREIKVGNLPAVRVGHWWAIRRGAVDRLGRRAK